MAEVELGERVRAKVREGRTVVGTVEWEGSKGGGVSNSFSFKGSLMQGSGFYPQHWGKEKKNNL